MADKGWIKLHRSLQDCWIWTIDEPFDKRSAWVDLLMLANHKDVKLMFNGELATIQRGQILTSVRKLSSRWKWSTNKVYRFLNQLQIDFMVQRESDNYRTLITIVKYGVYQCSENTNGYTDEYTKETPTDTLTKTPTEYKQECKELKNNNYIHTYMDDESVTRTDIPLTLKFREE